MATDPKWPSDFGPVPLPDWITADSRWEQQLDIARDVVERFRTNDAVFLQAPTGVGKSLIGELVRRLMGVGSVYSCTTKALQDQYVGDFTYAKVLKGRSNYPTYNGRVDGYGFEVEGVEQVTCADCNWTTESARCSWCPSRGVCPYVIARTRAETAPLAVLNSSYLLTDMAKGMGRFRGRGLYVLDEADKLEDEFLSMAELNIGKRRVERMGLAYPRKKTVPSSWLEWVEQTIPKVREYRDSLDYFGFDPKQIREYKYSDNLYETLLIMQRELPEGGWVYDGYSRDNIIFRPVRVHRYGNRLLWNAGQKFLLMSATILSADIMVDELGFTFERDRPYDMVDLDSPFPMENRPVHVVPVAEMTYKNKEAAYPAMFNGIVGVLNLHPDERILIHTVNYELAKYITNQLKNARSRLSSDEMPGLHRPIHSYLSSNDKGDALARYKQDERAVMVAASMDRGIDLPGDLCRVQVIAKVPYPNTGDKRINARLHSVGGSNWYRMQTVRTIVQMTGRGVRNKDDKATTYILDGQFGSNIWQGGEYLFPKWWRDSLNWRFNKRRLKVLGF